MKNISLFWSKNISLFWSLVAFSAKLILFYGITIVMLFPALNVTRLAGTVKPAVKAWSAESLSGRGIVYSALIIKKDPEAAAEMARYMELIGEHKAAIAAWDAAAETLQRRSQPLTDKVIQDNIDRLKTREGVNN